MRGPPGAGAAGEGRSSRVASRRWDSSVGDGNPMSVTYSPTTSRAWSYGGQRVGPARGISPAPDDVGRRGRNQPDHAADHPDVRDEFAASREFATGEGEQRGRDRRGPPVHRPHQGEGQDARPQPRRRLDGRRRRRDVGTDTGCRVDRRLDDLRRLAARLTDLNPARASGYPETGHSSPSHGGGAKGRGCRRRRSAGRRRPAAGRGTARSRQRPR